MPDQPVQNRGRPLGASACRARRPPPPLSSQPKLFVITGPSGAGKGTLIRALAARRDDLEVAISATTRPLRRGERDGREYYFLTDEEFADRVGRGEFLENVPYVSGRYGTLKSEVQRIFAAGKNCVLELETHGARTVSRELPEAVTIFVAAPSFAELERRLRDRATESAGEIGRRLEIARRQMDEAGDFHYVVVNDELERAVTKLEALVDRELAATLSRP